MLSIGRIEALSESAEIAPKRWLELIDSHESLTHVPPYKRTNPFTRQPMEVKAPASTANAAVDGISIGTIFWAMDGSSILFVDAEEESAEQVARIAEDVAAKLGARFVRDMAGELEV